MKQINYFLSLVVLSVFALLVGCKKDNPAPEPAPEPIVATSITLNRSSVTELVNFTVQLKATTVPEGASVVWSTENDKIATVSNEGLVTFVGDGTTTVTAKSGDQTATCEMVVLDNDVTDLSENGTANCYIVNHPGTYSFAIKKGNTGEVVEPTKIRVLWESFGTDVAPQTGDIVTGVFFKKGKVYFKTKTMMKDGNALISAQESDGTILWSWHIWACAGYDPSTTAQSYSNNAGTMMDRNLGATTSAPGDVKALGLLYQWGRKDPFLGAKSISVNARSASTLTSWPVVKSDATTGTIAYAIAHPTTFIGCNEKDDWYYSEGSGTDNTRWKSAKTMYDPCPAGWRVPDGGPSGFWATAAGSSSGYSIEVDATNKGIRLNTASGSSWYPYGGELGINDGVIRGVGTSNRWWSCTGRTDKSAYAIYCNSSTAPTNNVIPANTQARAMGCSVRCFKE